MTFKDFKVGSIYKDQLPNSGRFDQLYIVFKKVKDCMLILWLKDLYISLVDIDDLDYCYYKDKLFLK